MASVSTELPAAAKALQGWLLEGKADREGVRVVDANVAWDEDADAQPILRFVVSLADPEGETWPIDEILAFHRQVDEQARNLGLDVPRYVGLEAEVGEEVDPD